MKKLKFREPLPEMILNGKKDITWRINDEKNIARGDGLSLCRNDGKEFAKAKAVWVKETIFKHLTAKDKGGHEKFASDGEMYQHYSRLYRIEVTPETRVKIIKFKLL